MKYVFLKIVKLFRKKILTFINWFSNLAIHAKIYFIAFLYLVTVIMLLPNTSLIKNHFNMMIVASLPIFLFGFIFDIKIQKQKPNSFVSRFWERLSLIKNYLMKIITGLIAAILVPYSYAFSQKIIGSTLSLPPEFFPNSTKFVTPFVWIYFFSLLVMVILGILMFVPMFISVFTKQKLVISGRIFGLLTLFVIISWPLIHYEQFLHGVKGQNLRQSLIVHLDYQSKHHCYNLNPNDYQYVTQLDGKLVSTASKRNGKWNFEIKECKYLVIN